MKPGEFALILAEVPEKKLEIFKMLDKFMEDGKINFEKAIEECEAVESATDEVWEYVDHVKEFARTISGL